MLSGSAAGFALAANGVDAEQAVRDAVRPVELYGWIRDLCAQLMQRQATLHRKRFERGIVHVAYHLGFQRIMRRPGGGLIVEPVQHQDQPVISHNYFRPYSDEVTASWMQSHPEIQWAAICEDKRQARVSRRAFQQLQRYWSELWLTEKVRQITAMGAQLFAGYGFEVFYDPDDSNGLEWFDEYVPVPDRARVFYECPNPDCPEPMGELNPQMPVCAGCGNNDVLRQEYPAVEGERLADSYYRQAGEVVIKPVLDMQVRYDLTVGREESPYLYVEEDRPIEEVEANLGRKLPGTSGAAAWADEDVMHPLRFLRRVGRHELMGADNDDRHQVLLQRFFIEPEMYAFVQLDRATTLPDGEQLPAGTRLIERFPEGFCVLTVPGADRFLALAEGSHKRRFRWGNYGLALGRHDGYGIDDAREPQRQINVFRSALMRGLQKFLVPSVAVNTNVFRNARLFNLPDQVIGIKDAELPEGTRISDHFAPIVAPGFNPQMFALLDMLEADIQRGTKAYNSAGDAPGVDNKTATAARIALNKTATAQNLHLGLYAGCLKETLHLAMELAQPNYENQRLVRSLDPATRQRQNTVVKAADIRQQYMTWVAVGSYLPDLDIEKRAKLIEGATAKTALLGAGVPDEDANRLVNRYFALDLGETEQDAIDDRLEDLLTLWQEHLQATGGMALPEELNALRPVSVMHLGNKQTLQAARLWLTEESDSADPLIVMAMEMRVQMLFDAVAEETYLTQYAAAGGAMGEQAMLERQMLGSAAQGKAGSGKQPTPSMKQPGGGFGLPPVSPGKSPGNMVM